REGVERPAEGGEAGVEQRAGLRASQAGGEAGARQLAGEGGQLRLAPLLLELRAHEVHIDDRRRLLGRGRRLPEGWQLADGLGRSGRGRRRGGLSVLGGRGGRVPGGRGVGGLRGGLGRLVGGRLLRLRRLASGRLVRRGLVLGRGLVRRGLVLGRGRGGGGSVRAARSGCRRLGRGARDPGLAGAGGGGEPRAA